MSCRISLAAKGRAEIFWENLTKRFIERLERFAAFVFKNSPMAHTFTDDNFEEEVLKSEQPVLVDFWAQWCGPCQAMGPIIEELAEEVKATAKVGKLDVDENPKRASEYGIMSIPSLKIFKGGKVVKEFMGLQQKEVLKDALSKA